MYMSYSMSYTWYDVTCNVGICKSKSTLRDASYHIRRMTGWALSCCGMRVAGCALYHTIVLHCDVTQRYAVTSLRVALSLDFSPERHPTIRHIHVKISKSNKIITQTYTATIIKSFTWTVTQKVLSYSVPYWTLFTSKWRVADMLLGYEVRYGL